jgi:hypothetical protein
MMRGVIVIRKGTHRDASQNAQPDASASEPIVAPDASDDRES